MPLSKLPLSLIISAICITPALLGCGGGSDGDTYTSHHSSPATPTPPKQTPPPKPSFTLEPSASIPKLKNNDSLAFKHTMAGEQALTTGIYKPKLVTLISDKNNCPSFGSVGCPSFDRIWLDANGQFNRDSWAYLPTDKSWVQLDAFHNLFRFSFGDFFSDGSEFSSKEFDPEEAQWSHSPSGFTAPYLNAARFKLSVADKNISDLLINPRKPATGNYGKGAVGYDINIGLAEGEYYYFEDTDSPALSYRQSSNDASTYKTLEAYRAAHTNKQSVVCAIEEGKNKGLVFNPSKLGATLYTLKNSSCSNEVDTNKPNKTIPEYIKLIDNRKVIVMPSLSFDSVANNSYYTVLTLNDNGVAAQGRGYQKGYGIKNSDFVNETAFIAWLKTFNNETSALVLPGKTR